MSAAPSSGAGSGPGNPFLGSDPGIPISGPPVLAMREDGSGSGMGLGAGEVDDPRMLGPLESSAGLALSGMVALAGGGGVDPTRRALMGAPGPSPALGSFYNFLQP